MTDWTVLYTSRNRRPFLVGRADGDYVSTSPIAKVEGRVVTTYSGGVYALAGDGDDPLAGVTPRPQPAAGARAFNEWDSRVRAALVGAAGERYAVQDVAQRQAWFETGAGVERILDELVV